MLDARAMVDVYSINMMSASLHNSTHNVFWHQHNHYAYKCSGVLMLSNIVSMHRAEVSACSGKFT